MSEFTAATDSGVEYTIVGDGPPLLLIAGFGQPGEVWNAVLPRFSRTFRCHVFDNRGVGQQANCTTGLTVDALADDAASILRSIGEPAAVLGWSLGGAIAQRLAYQHPELVRMLVLLSTMARRSELQRNWTAAQLALVAGGAKPMEIETVLLPWMFTPALLSDTARAEAIVQANARLHPVAPEGLRAQAAALDQFDAAGWLQEIGVPALVVVGAEDTLTPVSAAVELVNGLPRAELVVLPRGGHAAILEAPNQVTPPILRFLYERTADHTGSTAHQR